MERRRKKERERRDELEWDEVRCDAGWNVRVMYLLAR